MNKFRLSTKSKIFFIDGTENKILNTSKKIYYKDYSSNISINNLIKEVLLRQAPIFKFNDEEERINIYTGKVIKNVIEVEKSNKSVTIYSTLLECAKL